LINNNVFAQSIEKNPNFKVTQVESENDFFEVKGKVKFDRKYNKSNRVADVYIYDENKKLIKSLETNENGVFKITLDKKDFKGKMIFRIEYGRQSKEKVIENLDLKNIKFKVKFNFPTVITPGYF
jgi:flagellar hook assembly protein FlgD